MYINTLYIPQELGIKISPYQIKLIEQLIRTSDGKITLQSMTRGIELWKSQKDGIITSQAALLTEQSRLVHRGSDSGKLVADASDSAANIAGSPDQNGINFKNMAVSYCRYIFLTYIILANSRHYTAKRRI